MDIDIFQMARLGETTELEKLKKSGLNLNTTNERGENILHSSIAYNKPETAILAISLGVDVNKQSKHGRSPLHVACDVKLFEVCQKLIEAGADINLCDEIGRQPLWEACWLPKGDFRIIELLLQNGADPEHIDKNGISPMSSAKKKNNLHLVDLMSNNR